MKHSALVAIAISIIGNPSFLEQLQRQKVSLQRIRLKMSELNGEWKASFILYTVDSGEVVQGFNWKARIWAMAELEMTLRQIARSVIRIFSGDH